MGRAAPLIETAAWRAGFSDVSHAATMEEAVERAATRARPGDAVMLAPVCASFDMYANFEERGQVFRDAVRVYLEGTT
jgi:UDP-N-acetylmuramoylalanine--D-glutamate ligase